MTATCPAGHRSTAEDYCDVCGMPIDVSAPAPVSAAAPVPSSAPVGIACPHCSTQNVAEALFCEACGYDFTTGTMPRTAVASPAPDVAVDAPASGSPGADAPADTPTASSAAVTATADFDWVVELWIDPDWYEAQESPDPMPSPGLPTITGLRGASVLVGRPSRSRNIAPDIDCEPDSGTSRRQAQLTTDGSRWWVEDLESSNGTFVAQASGPLPTVPITVGVKHELKPDDRVYVGAWTRFVVRPATDDEKTSLA